METSGYITTGLRIPSRGEDGLSDSLQPDPDSAEALIFKASKGDLDAFNELVLKYQGMVYGQAYALLGDQDSAEDATQESFIKAFQRVGGFRGGSFRAWLLRIVRNTSYDMQRLSKRRPTLPLFFEDENGEERENTGWLTDPGPSVQEIAERKEDAKQLYRMLDELPENYRSVLILVDLHELDYAEAAKTLGIPIGTVKSRLARARLQMKEKLLGHQESQRSPNLAEARACA